MLKTQDEDQLPEIKRGEITDELNQLLAIIPEQILELLEADLDLDNLVEIVMDLGRTPEARFPDRAVYLPESEVTFNDINQVVARVGSFTSDNRAGIERTLHRISAVRNRKGEIIGLTCRVGRAITGTVDIIRDFIETGKSLLLLGPPGVGKTTLLREAARVLADELEKRVVVVDTSNEIAGDGDVPHPAIGHARRMQVPSPEKQHDVMIEAVENHMPEVIVIDEIGTELEAMAARTIAERGVQLVATAHGVTLENLVMNPTLSDLVGGIQPVTLSDEEARRRRTQKTVLERKAPPTFDILVEIQDRDRLAIYSDIASVVDRLLAGIPLKPEIRVRGPNGTVTVKNPYGAGGKNDSPSRIGSTSGQLTHQPRRRRLRRPVRIYPLGISRTRLERAIKEIGIAAKLADQPINADVILTLKAQRKRQPKKLQQVLDRGVEFYTLRSNTLDQLKSFLIERFGSKEALEEVSYQSVESALQEAEDAIVQIQRSHEPVELAPRNSYVRRMQHELIGEHGLKSESVGESPFRRITVLPG
ncbi:MAG TPA: R3H domain-containing nucleic acid-binding protein [Acidobacteriota bacterium]|nr:R3H domain-containing nucleic acid-binding protein [Acidobacteriota bacterium]